MSNQTIVDTEKIYTNSKGLQYRILKTTGKRNSNRYCLVHFIESGFEKEAPYAAALKGYVKDDSVSVFDYDPEKIYQSTKDGPYKILDVWYESSKGSKARIKFINTGYEKVVPFDSAKKGGVKDDSLRVIDPNQVFCNISGKTYNIIEKIDCKTVKVKFIETGYETNADRYAALHGMVKDKSFANIDPNVIFMSYESGPFKVIEKTDKRTHDGRQLYLVEFCRTGYRRYVTLSQITSRQIRDETIETPIHELHNISKAEYDIFMNNRLRGMYRNMMGRCYNTQHKWYDTYGAAGVTVCPEWQTYEGFISTIHQVFQYEKFINNFYDYVLDKDYLQLHLPKNQRVYSPSTCAFLHYWDNENVRNIDIKNNTPSQKYYGVSLEHDTYYHMAIMYNKRHIHMLFSDAIAAANAYNYLFEYFHRYDIVPLHNDVPYMPVEEWIKYSTKHKCIYDVIAPEPADSPLVMLGKA